MRPFFYAVLTAVLLALTAPSAWAQGATTSAISGTVRDAQGGPLPGANVVAVHTPSGTRYGAATRADGRYDLQGLRVGGPYTVRVTFIGFQPIEQTGIQLSLNRTETLDFQMQDGETLGEVTVSADRADAVIAQSRTGAATAVTEEAIEALPTIGRSLSDFARLSPLASASGSSTSVGGRNNRFNNIQVDGATLNDVFGLAASGTPGGQSGTQPVSLDAVEAFNVEVAPYDVRQGGFTGGLVNVITRSGTNRLGGSLRFLTRDERFVGDRARNGVLIPQSPFSDNIYVATLGGPIRRDKLFFFLSGEVAQSDFPNETGLLGTNAPNIFPATEATLNSIIQIARDSFAYDPGSAALISNARDSYKLLAKLDWNIGTGNRLSVRHNFVTASDDQGNTRNSGAFDLSNRRFQFRNLQNSTAATLNTTFSNRMFNEARLVYTAIRDQRDVPDGAAFPSVQVRLSPNEIVRLGTERSSQANALDQDLFEFTNNLTYFAGDHNLTLGTSNQLFRFRNLFIQDYYGTYEFDGGFQADLDGDGDLEQALGIDAFRLGRPSRYQFSYASPLNLAGNGALTFVCGRDVNDLDRDGDRLERFDYGSERCDTDGELLADRLVATDQRPEAEFVGGQLGLYVQDAWSVTDDLTLTLGLRADLPFFPDTPTFNPLVAGGTGTRPDGSTFNVLPAFREEAYVRAYADALDLDLDATVAAYNDPAYAGTRYADYSTLSTDEVPNGNLLFSPRLGVNLRVDGLAGRDLQIRGGTGIFSGRTPYVWISNQFSNTGADFARLNQTFSTGAPAGFFAGSANPADQPVPGIAAGLDAVATSALAITDPDFRFPQVWRSNLGLDQALPFGLTATVEGIYTANRSDVAFQNLNIVPVSQAADGRILYNVPSQSTAFSAVPRVNGNFIDAILLTNANRGYEYSLVGQLQRRVDEGLGGSLSYTYGRALTVNNATSSVAYSNWRFNESSNPNDIEELGTSDFEVRHRFLAFASYRAVYGRFSSQLGLVGDVRSGEPFSFIYANDANGDGETSNDLVYVPARATDVFLSTGSQAYNVLDAYIRGQQGLNAFRGEIVPRNSGRGPWQPRLDLEFTQGIETVRGQRVDFEVTLLNLLNLLDADLGVIRSANNNAVPAFTFDRYIVREDVGTRFNDRVVTQDDIGKPVITFSEQSLRNTLTGDRFATDNVASRWQLRFGLKYTF